MTDSAVSGVASVTVPREPVATQWMADEVRVCNIALAQIGVTQRIGSLKEASEPARLCDLLYPITRDTLLRSAPWSFARVVDVLADFDGDAPVGWTYAYVYPGDCAMALRVTTVNGSRYANGVTSLENNDGRLEPIRVPWEVRVATGFDQKIIVTDIQPAYLEYTRQIANPQLFGADFSFALSCKVAAAIAPGLRADAGLAQAAEGRALQAISEARANYMNERQVDARAESPSISIRG